MITLGTGNESVSMIDGELPCVEYSVQTQHYVFDTALLIKNN